MPQNRTFDPDHNFALVLQSDTPLSFVPTVDGKPLGGDLHTLTKAFGPAVTFTDLPEGQAVANVVDLFSEELPDLSGLTLRVLDRSTLWQA